MDRRKPGSKHHLLTDAGGLPLAVLLTEANRHDVTQLIPLVQSLQPIRGRVGRPRRRPEALQGDAAYCSRPLRRWLSQRGMKPLIPARKMVHGSGLGKTRWVVERTLSWLHQFRRLRVRYERRSEIHQAFLSLACALLCWRRLNGALC